MTKNNNGAVNANGRDYKIPTVPSVVICFDGCDPRVERHGDEFGYNDRRKNSENDYHEGELYEREAAFGVAVMGHGGSTQKS